MSITSSENLISKPKSYKKGKVKKVKPRYVQIEVASKRGVKIREEKKCDSCSKSFRIVWKYEKTSIGMAYLCYSCKDRILKIVRPIRIIYTNPESSRKKY